MHSSNSSSSSSLITDDYCGCSSSDEVSNFASKRHLHRQLRPFIHLPNTIIFGISLNDCGSCLSSKRFSVELQLLSYSFLVRLINRTYNLRSNFTIIAQQSSTLNYNLPIRDDFDVDGYLMSTHEADECHRQPFVFEFVVHKFPQTKDQLEYNDNDEWCVVDDNCTTSNEKDDNFELIPIRNDSIMVTVKAKDARQESFLQRATSWLHGSVHSSGNNCLTKREFIQMLDRFNGRLLDEQAFRQRIFDSGCDESIRKVVWCYLLRVYNESMTKGDKIEYGARATDRYNDMRQAWQNRQSQNDPEIVALDNLIRKDVRRTDCSVKFFADKENLSRQKLLNILMTYSVYHPEPGYSQGMTDMVAPILYVVRDEALTYACFCSLMRHMGSLFHSDNVAMKRRLDLLRKTVRAIDFDLWNKIEQYDTGNLMFAYRWLLLDCKREFPFKDVFRVLETLWAALPVDRFESNNTNTISDTDDLCPSSICGQNRSSMVPSITNTILSSRSCSPTLEETSSQHSSFDGGDSGYRDEQILPIFDLHPFVQQEQEQQREGDNSTPNISPKIVLTGSANVCIPLGKWLTHFSSIEDDYPNSSSDMFTIFLCVALLEQSRLSIIQMCPLNTDDDDYIGCHFTRLVRQHDARQALQLARNYHRQYVLFQMRVKQLLLT